MRFIEFMPLDASDEWQRDQVVGQDEIVAAIDAVWPLELVPARGAAPADRWRYLDGAGTVGVIPTVTKPFCGDCDRVRLTADGQFRTCLFATDEFDLRRALRAGETDDEIAARIERGGRHEVGRPPDQPGELHPARAVDEPDRRLIVVRRAAAVPWSSPSASAGSPSPRDAIDERATVDAGRRRCPDGRPRSVGARVPAPTMPGTATSRRPRCARLGGDRSHRSRRTAATPCIPTSVRTPSYGIPYVVVPPSQPRVPIAYVRVRRRERSGPVPDPADAPIEGGAGATGRPPRDRRAAGTCELFELFGRSRAAVGLGGRSGARFDLSSNALRPLGWTSADAAGLPILPGLVRYDEVAAGSIRHAIRITFSRTQRGYVLPATHFASVGTDPTLPPMGLRLRLRADVRPRRLTGQAWVIAAAMQRYGVIVADNGSNWFFQGAPDPVWDDDDLDQLKSIPGTAFEVVDTGPIVR